MYQNLSKKFSLPATAALSPCALRRRTLLIYKRPRNHPLRAIIFIILLPSVQNSSVHLLQLIPQTYTITPQISNLPKCLTGTALTAVSALTTLAFTACVSNAVGSTIVECATVSVRYLQSVAETIESHNSNISTVSPEISARAPMAILALLAHRQTSFINYRHQFD